jgi:hypothetical protein
MKGCKQGLKEDRVHRYEFKYACALQEVWTCEEWTLKRKMSLESILKQCMSKSKGRRAFLIE